MFNSHKIDIPESAFFDISGVYAPISIKDQIFRASTIIEIAKEKKILGKGKKLLVIGGGFTGVTAAIKAAESGVETYLIEKENSLFPKFRFVNRFICPNQYDYPQKNWEFEEFPVLKDSFIPVRWKAESGAKMATRFSRKLIKYKGSIPLYVAQGANCIIDKASNTVEIESNNEKPVVFNPTPKEIPENFDMVLSCLGIGPERVTVPNTNYSGIPFWKFQGFRKTIRDKDILICGVGDGGLQDFLLLATEKNFVRDIYLDVMRKIDSNLQRKVEFRILKIHDNAVRNRHFFNQISREMRCHVEKQTHESYRQLVNEFYGVAGPTITEELSKITTSEFKKSKLILAYPCNHFTWCYPLNHFLVLLLAKHLEHFNNENSFLLDHTRITNVRGESPHQCRNNPLECFGKKHIVEAEQATCTNVMPGEFSWTRKPSLVLIRFGIRQGFTIGNIRKLYGAVPKGCLEDTIIPYEMPSIT